MVLVGGILLILGISLASTNYMIDAQVPQQLIELVTQLHHRAKRSFLLLLIGFLLLIGCILHIFSALVLVVPLMLPVAARYGVDPVHLGIIFVATMELGYLLPPIGLNLYISSYRFNRPVLEVCVATLPFILILLGAVLLITFVPCAVAGFRPEVTRSFHEAASGRLWPRRPAIAPGGRLRNCWPSTAGKPAEFLRVPAGFSAEILVDNVPNARSMALGEKGTLFVGTQSGGTVYAVRDALGRESDRAQVCRRPDDAEWRGPARWRPVCGRAEAHHPFSRCEKQRPGPTGGQPPAGSRGSGPAIQGCPAFLEVPGHWPGQQAVCYRGSPCNVCVEPGFGVILRMNPDGTDREVYASGIRNSVGFDWRSQVQRNSGSLTMAGTCWVTTFRPAN